MIQFILPRKYRPPFQKGKGDDESFKSIEELRAFDRKKKLNKEYRRIRI